MIRIRKAPARSLPPMDARERNVARAVLRAAHVAAAGTSLIDLARLLEANDAVGAVAVIPWGDAESLLASELPRQYRIAHQQGGERGARQLLQALRRLRKASGVGWGFDAVNPYSVVYARTASANLITQWGASSREAIQTLIARAFEEGIPPRDIAKLIRGSGIGLTSRQAQAVERLRASLLEQGMAAARIESRLTRYGDQLLRQRAEAIARTEIITAEAQGSLASWEDAAREGLLDRRTATKEWMYTPVGACDACTALDGVAVPLAAMFHSGVLGIDVPGPTLHPCCRCALAINP